MCLESVCFFAVGHFNDFVVTRSNINHNVLNNIDSSATVIHPKPSAFQNISPKLSNSVGSSFFFGVGVNSLRLRFPSATQTNLLKYLYYPTYLLLMFKSSVSWFLPHIKLTHITASLVLIIFCI